jgi:hypothetical protein
VDIFFMIGFESSVFLRLYGYATGPMVLGLILGPCSTPIPPDHAGRKPIIPFLQVS